MFLYILLIIPIIGIFLISYVKLKKVKFKYFYILKNLIFNIFNFFLFIYPYVLVFKSLYLCYLEDTWTFVMFSKNIVSNIPFFEIFSQCNNKSSVYLDNFNEMILLIFSGSIFGLIKTIFETFGNHEVPMVMGGKDLPKMPHYTAVISKVPLISNKGSDLGGGSPLSLAKGSEGGSPEPSGSGGSPSGSGGGSGSPSGSGSGGSASSFNQPAGSATAPLSGSTLAPDSASSGSVVGGVRQPSTHNLPPFETRGLNLDVRNFNFGSLWPNLILTGSSELETLTHPSIDKSVIAYNLQSKAQLENILAHYSYAYPKENSPYIREVVFGEAVAEYKRRIFLEKYKGSDTAILEDKKKMFLLENSWKHLYEQIGKKGPYRENWEKTQPEVFKDRKTDVYLEADTINVDPRETSYKDLIESIKKARFIADKFNSSLNNSKLGLDMAKAAWEENCAKKSFKDIEAKPEGSDEVSKAKNLLEKSKAKRKWAESEIKSLTLYEAQNKQRLEEVKKIYAQSQEAMAKIQEDKALAQLEKQRAEANKVYWEDVVRRAALDENMAKNAENTLGSWIPKYRKDLEETQAKLARSEAIKLSKENAVKQAALAEAKTKKVLEELESKKGSASSKTNE